MAELSRQLRRWRAAETLACSALKSWVKQSFPQASRVLLQLLVPRRDSPHPLGYSGLLESGRAHLEHSGPHGAFSCAPRAACSAGGGGGGAASLGFVFPLLLCHISWTRV